MIGERDCGDVAREDGVTEARRRRRRALAGVVTAAILLAVCAGAGVAAVTGTPLDRLIGGEDPGIGIKPGTTRVELRSLDPAGLRWTSASWVTEHGLLALAAAADGGSDRLPEVGGAAPFVVADNLLEGPFAQMTFTIAHRGGVDHYLLSGTVDARAREMHVTLGGMRRTASLSEDTISAPVERPPDGELTPEGERRAARWPDRVTLRLFTVSFPPDSLRRAGIVRGNVETMTADGGKYTEDTAPLCTHGTCEAAVDDGR